MDWGTVAAATASSLVSGGLIGGAVSYWVARRESNDRQDALTLERDKWEHDKGTTQRQRSTAALVEALALLEQLRADISGCHQALLADGEGVDKAFLLHVESSVNTHQRIVFVTLSLESYGLAAAKASMDAAADKAAALTNTWGQWLRSPRDGAIQPMHEVGVQILRSTAILHESLKAL